jgi:hypothetical protein
MVKTVSKLFRNLLELEKNYRIASQVDTISLQIVCMYFFYLIA